MILRRYTPADAEDVLRLAQAFHVESPVHCGMPFSRGKVRALLDAASQDPDWMAQVLCDDDVGIVGLLLAGTIEPFFTDARELVDLTLYIAPDHRRGRGFLLMIRALERHAAATGADRITLGINTGIDHEGTLTAMLKMGFRVQGLAVSKPVH